MPLAMELNLGVNFFHLCEWVTQWVTQHSRCGRGVVWGVVGAGAWWSLLKRGQMAWGKSHKSVTSAPMSRAYHTTKTCQVVLRAVRWQEPHQSSCRGDNIEKLLVMMRHPVVQADDRHAQLLNIPVFQANHAVDAGHGGAPGCGAPGWRHMKQLHMHILESFIDGQATSPSPFSPGTSCRNP